MISVKTFELTIGFIRTILLGIKYKIPQKDTDKFYNRSFENGAIKSRINKETHKVRYLGYRVLVWATRKAILVFILSLVSHFHLLLWNVEESILSSSWQATRILGWVTLFVANLAFQNYQLVETGSCRFITKWNLTKELWSYLSKILCCRRDGRGGICCALIGVVRYFKMRHGATRRASSNTRHPALRQRRNCRNHRQRLMKPASS